VDPVRDPFVAPATRRDVDVPDLTGDWLMGGFEPPFRAVAGAPTTGDALSRSGLTRARRRALCVGINAYTRSPLNGCVADARTWARTLQGLGFELPVMLLDGQATRDRILAELESLIRTSTPGDLIVFQYAGHGTTVPDRNGDEIGGDSPANDEALCPIDFTEGRLIIDDDLAAVLSRIPDGVRVTSFVDACHSGSVSRIGLGPQAQRRGTTDERPRFVVADDRLIEAHVAFRAAYDAPRVSEARPRALDRDILISACRSTEVAWESNGQGDFTRHATRVLAQGMPGATHGDFLARVQTAFGGNARQHPEIYPPGASAIGLLTPEPARTTDSAVAPALGQSGDVAALLRTIADMLSTR
jgi:hypothetical protein